MLAGCAIPFLPRQEIDTFPLSRDLVETMEVREVVYVRVNNPDASADDDAEPTLWVPSSVYRSGKYEACTLNLPQPESAVAVVETVDEANASNLASPQNSVAEQLTETPQTILPLRRRALLFPTRVTAIQPEIATLLGLELEKALPVRILESQNLTLRDQGRLLNQPNEITQAVKSWLKQGRVPAPVQFVLFLTTSPGRHCHFYTCTWIDAQTGNNVATFTFRAHLNGKLIRPLVPPKPAPLLRLVASTSWWCKIKNRRENDNYILDAGHRSDLNYGRELQVFAKAVAISDPQNKNSLGFRFTEPLGSVSVVDFFAADGSLAQARTPLSTDFSEAWAVEIEEAPEE